MSSQTTPSDVSPVPPLATRREWIGLGILSIACLIYSMDLSVLFLAMPAIMEDLRPDAVESLWINDIYGFMVSGFLITMGSLGDRIGRRKILLIGSAFFGLASIVAAMSTSASMLIGSRALLGIAGATIAPSTLSLVVSMFRNDAERNQAIGIWGTAFSMGGLIGPVLGGFLLQYFHWGSVFLINVPIMAALLVLAPFLLPEYKSPSTHRIDLYSVALSLFSVLAIIYGFKQMANDGLHWQAIATTLAGFAIGTLFVQRQKQLDDPLIDLALFRVPPFVVSLLVNLLGIFFIFGIYFFQNQYLQLVLNLSPLEAGLWSVAPSLVYTGMSLFSYKITNRIGPARSVVYGLCLFAFGILLMGIAGYVQNLIGILGASMVMGFGFVPVILTTTGLLVGSAPPERAGAASAIGETSAELGGALGVAILGSLATLVYRALMMRVPLESLPADAASAIRNTLGLAVEEARRLNPESAPDWLLSARIAFADGFALICLLATLCLFVLAVIARNVYARHEVKTADH